MSEYPNAKFSVYNEKKASSEFVQKSNPLSAKINDSDLALTNFSQSLSRHQYDIDMADVLEVVRILNNMAPIRMPEYNFNIDEINGEHYYKPDGSLLLIREYDSDVIRDYYANLASMNPEYTVSRILEHDKNTGRLRAKIEPVLRAGSKLKTTISWKRVLLKTCSLSAQYFCVPSSRSHGQAESRALSIATTVLHSQPPRCVTTWRRVWPRWLRSTTPSARY
jgi:hypothetical protein